MAGKLPVRVEDAPSPRYWYAATKMFLEAIGRGYAETHGITLDAIAPMRYAFIGISPPTPTTVTTPSALNVLGVRYVIAMPDDAVSDRLRLVRTAAGGVRIFENPDAWPEAFFVSKFPPASLPRLANCGNDRFLCADFGRAGIDREPACVDKRPASLLDACGLGDDATEHP